MGGHRRRGRCLPLESVKDKDDAAIYHVPLVEGHIVEIIGDKAVVGNAKCLKHGLLPEATSAHYSSDGVNDAERENAFNRAGNDAKGEGASEILVPSLNVEGQCC